ncbi:hypothetical protein ACHAW5_009868 [Stephanodiscus triporus]|uniref:Uncharacterized protein n=1 Tax=Stephanodiscus triporus TaxID=2934178 RepID=A0ABD3QL92_9STRA
MTRARRDAHRAIALIASALLLLLLESGSSRAFAFAFAFVGPRLCPRGRASHRPIIVVARSSTDDDNDDDGGDDFGVFFDDFGGGFPDDGGGDPSPSSSSSSSSSSSLSDLLRSRMGEVRGAEAAYDAKLARNWRRGNWSVRGFSLDKFPATTTTTSPDAVASARQDDVVRVSVVVAPASSCRDADVSPPARDGDLSVAVGTTDGSVFVVKLGDEYLTKFAADDDDGGADVGRTRSDDCGPGADDDDDDDYGRSNSARPFEIEWKFAASDRGEAIHGLVYHDSIEGDDERGGGIICTAAGASGDISMWLLPSHNTDDGGIVRAAVLGGVHNDQIVSLKTMVLKPRGEDMDEQNVLFSASGDGKFALWNLDGNGELMLSCQCADVDAGKTTCADVFNPSSWDDGYGNSGESDNDVIFLGTSSGYVGHGNSMRWRWNDSNYGSFVESNAIKLHLVDWGRRRLREAMSSSSRVRMEHWPRMSSQRMKRRAHLFTPPHDGPVTCISQQGRQDPSKFLTSGKDGSVCVWSASSGKELFRMDGFGTVSSLACLGRELLVTDGMDEYVCVHDFGIAEDAAANGYELEW